MAFSWPSCCGAMILVVVVASCLDVALSHSDVGGPSFSYNTMSLDGPENWGKLSPDYKACGEGKAQSPIDIVTANAVPNPSLDNLTRVYAPTDATLTNNGKDISMTFDDLEGHSVAPGTILVCNPDGTMKAFGLKMIHWHSPSEHTIDGQRFPLELHLVHASEDGHLAVIGILYKIGDHDAFYDQLEDKLRELKTVHRVAAGVVELKSLQKRTGSYFRYMGSLTTPPCTENVIWNILGKVREISAEQLQLLTAPLPHKDNRPPQPLNGRTVQFYNPPNRTVSFQTI
ncbi:alpha carbonic anhydrase 7-like [Lolium rigidum]|nr:alpha carbonic anhydrase 7-like [Lolium rigidum]